MGEDGITTFIVDARSPGISCNVLKTIANDKLCEVIFDKVRVPKENVLGQLDMGWGDVEKMVERAAVAKCCDMVGCLQRVFEMTIAYAKERMVLGETDRKFPGCAASLCKHGD